jgi:phosphoglycolate phosphatase
MKSAILFDADGTLVDSLPPHVDFCHAMNVKHGCGLSLPPSSDVARCRCLSAAPMNNFLLKAGFAEALIPTLVEDYEANFARGFPVAPFQGIRELLAALKTSGYRLGIVTSNTAQNVRASLGPELSSLFEFILGIDNAETSKKLSIKTAVSRLQLPSESIMYIGDTLGDYKSAVANSLTFLGVNYGFEDLAALLPVDATEATVVHTVSELHAALVPKSLSPTRRLLVALRVQAKQLKERNTKLREQLVLM